MMKKMNLVRNVAMFLLAIAPLAVSARSGLFFGEEELPEVIEF